MLIQFSYGKQYTNNMHLYLYTTGVYKLIRLKIKTRCLLSKYVKKKKFIPISKPDNKLNNLN